MSNIVIFAIGTAVFALTVFGTVMASGVVLTRRFYEQNRPYTDRPGFENAGAGRPTQSDSEGLSQGVSAGS